MASKRQSKRNPPVRAWAEEIVLPSYLPAPPDKNPMFLEKRVYQGSSGKVYPLPFTDRIAEEKTDRRWRAVWIENEYLRVLVLPELGGRIHRVLDKTNGYDVVYYQPAIKPALVGLAGPWISGGIEFNWPQHHRPGTFLPVDDKIEEHADGSKTIWCSDHDPMCRMKGMHGVCLHPGSALLELKVRACNRTTLPQTFLWWANVATRVHEGYQSFFPPDVSHVADHARRSMSEYPLAKGWYYGVNYGARARSGRDRGTGPAPNDLSWYANIPTPCSYMCVGSRHDFFGGYDHVAEAGIVHVANHHISPGKKQWTWGNHPFGYAWDRNLTEADEEGRHAPYIELMAGVYTDNQPDFSFLAPGETKSWSQYWYPIQKIGPAQHANADAAVSLKMDRGGIRIGASAARRIPHALIRLEREGAALEWRADLAPGKPFLIETRQARRRWEENGSTLRLLDANGEEVLRYCPQAAVKSNSPAAATEPASPRDIASNDELFITGLHLEQYRHATRCPTLYWREALRRDPADARSNNALGLWHLRRGELTLAEGHFRRAIERLTRRNANPKDGEPFYNLGLCLRHLGREDEAYDAFYKATWSQANASASLHALAEIDCARQDWRAANDHLTRCLRLNADHLRARNLQAVVLRLLGKKAEAEALVKQTLAQDPLDWWARQLKGEPAGCDLQTRLDIAHDYARAGLLREAISVLDEGTGSAGKDASRRDDALPDQDWGALPLVHYTLGWMQERLGDRKAAMACYKRGASASPDYCFPSRVEEIAVLEAAQRSNPRDARAPYYLGNLFYDRRRHEEAIQLWERSTKLDPKYSVAWRNLGIGYFNVRHDAAKARRAYDRAFRANPADARLLFERDQLWKRTGTPPGRRLRELEKHRGLVQRRDDLSIELCALYNQTGQPAKALEVLRNRRFQPWEGGEGQALGQHARTHIALGREALGSGDFARARDNFARALESPANLGEATHLLANQSDIHFWLGCALEGLGEAQAAREQWGAAARFKGDFQEMSVRSFSEMTYYSARSWEKLGKAATAKKLLRELLAYARELAKRPAKIDYFATSLPTMLLFDDDLQERQTTTALFLEAQARSGLGERERAKALLQKVLQRDPNQPLAADLSRELAQ